MILEKPIKGLMFFSIFYIFIISKVMTKYKKPVRIKHYMFIVKFWTYQ